VDSDCLLLDEYVTGNNNEFPFHWFSLKLCDTYILLNKLMCCWCRPGCSALSQRSTSYPRRDGSGTQRTAVSCSHLLMYVLLYTQFCAV